MVSPLFHLLLFLGSLTWNTSRCVTECQRRNFNELEGERSLTNQRRVQKLNDKTWISHHLESGITQFFCKRVAAIMFDHEAVFIGIWKDRRMLNMLNWQIHGLYKCVACCWFIIIFIPKLAWNYISLIFLLGEFWVWSPQEVTCNFCNVEEKRPLFFSDNCGQSFGKFAEKVCIRILWWKTYFNIKDTLSHWWHFYICSLLSKTPEVVL